MKVVSALLETLSILGYEKFYYGKSATAPQGIFKPYCTRFEKLCNCYGAQGTSYDTVTSVEVEEVMVQLYYSGCVYSYSTVPKMITL